MLCFGCVLGIHFETLAEDNRHVVCSASGRDSGSNSDAHYYSEIFQADSEQIDEYEKQFEDFLRTNEPERIFSIPSCLHWYERDYAQWWLDDVTEDDVRRQHLRVYHTGWHPNFVDESKDSNYKEQVIRDFHIQVSDVPYNVQICVRDHECEDGDVVRVSVNDAELISDEITNEWQCADQSLDEGRYDIELHAVNGSGYKGGCSYINENTGELRVSGSNTQTQSWRHRGGAGSRAKIEIELQ